MTPQLISPYGGKLVNLLVSADEREALIARSNQLPSFKISPRALWARRIMRMCCTTCA
jgi:hypothetical protein